MKDLFLLFVITLFLNASVFADDKTWTGAVNNDWNNPGNWSGSSVPTSNDDVDIPYGTPECQLPANSTITCDFFTNSGTLTANNSTLQVYSFENDGSVDITEKFRLNASSSEGGFSNYGNITGSANSEFNIFRNEADNYYGTYIYNEGEISAGTVKMQGSVVSNAEGATISGDISLSCSSSVSNYGTIEGNTGENGDNIVFMAPYIENFGEIKAGSAIASGSGNGGSVLLFSSEQFENEGKIIGGNGGLVNGKGGSIFISTFNLIVKSMLEAGYSNGGWKGRGDPEAADVTLIAETITINTDDELITGGSMYVSGKNIEFTNINIFGGFLGDEDIDIYTSADGNIDFSGTHTEGALFSVMGDINLYSNNIIAPTEGLNFIMDPNPTQNPANTSIVKGDIGSEYFEYGGLYSEGSISVKMQNQSTDLKQMEYSITSQLGWADPTTGFTDVTDAFRFDSVDILFSIPGNITDETTDTVTMLLSIDGIAVDTGYAYITCIPTLFVGITENANNLKQITAYPNPFSQSIYINNTNNDKIDIFDLTGNLVQTIFTNNWDGTTINDNLALPGMYIIKKEGYQPIKVSKME